MENRTPATSIEVLGEEEYLNRTQNTLDEDKESIISFMDVNSKFELVWMNAKTNLAMDMAIKNNLKKQECMVEEMVPKEYHEFLNVFSEEKAASVREHYVGAYYILTFSISLSPSMVYERLLAVGERSPVLHPCTSPGRYHNSIFTFLSYLLSRPREVTQVFMYIR